MRRLISRTDGSLLDYFQFTPEQHFFSIGIENGLMPNPMFDPTVFAALYEDGNTTTS